MAEIVAKKCNGCSDIIDEDWYPWIEIPKLIIHTRKKDLIYKELDFCKSECISKFVLDRVLKPELYPEG